MAVWSTGAHDGPTTAVRWLRICNVVDLRWEECDERVLPLELFPLRFLAIALVKPAIIPSTL